MLKLKKRGNVLRKMHYCERYFNSTLISQSSNIKQL